VDGNAQAAFVARVEQLLAHFLKGALGLTLRRKASETRDMTVRQRAAAAAATGALGDPVVWAAWRTDRGVVTVRGGYDQRQSSRLNEHVVYLEWWMEPDIHHEGWWRCSIKRPLEWTLGRGAASA
jgi:hypothetical protein